MFEDTPRLLKILVMVGGDGGDEGGRRFKCLDDYNFTIRSVLEECVRWLKYDDY